MALWFVNEWMVSKQSVRLTVVQLYINETRKKYFLGLSYSIVAYRNASHSAFYVIIFTTDRKTFESPEICDIILLIYCFIDPNRSEICYVLFWHKHVRTISYESYDCMNKLHFPHLVVVSLDYIGFIANGFDSNVMAVGQPPEDFLIHFWFCALCWRKKWTLNPIHIMKNPPLRVSAVFRTYRRVNS